MRGTYRADLKIMLKRYASIMALALVVVCLLSTGSAPRADTTKLPGTIKIFNDTHKQCAYVITDPARTEIIFKGEVSRYSSVVIPGIYPGDYYFLWMCLPGNARINAIQLHIEQVDVFTKGWGVTIHDINKGVEL